MPLNENLNASSSGHIGYHNEERGAINKLETFIATHKKY